MINIFNRKDFNSILEPTELSNLGIVKTDRLSIVKKSTEENDVSENIDIDQDNNTENIENTDIKQNNNVDINNNTSSDSNIVKNVTIVIEVDKSDNVKQSKLCQYAYELKLSVNKLSKYLLYYAKEFKNRSNIDKLNTIKAIYASERHFLYDIVKEDGKWLDGEYTADKAFNIIMDKIDNFYKKQIEDTKLLYNNFVKYLKEKNIEDIRDMYILPELSKAVGECNIILTNIAKVVDTDIILNNTIVSKFKSTYQTTVNILEFFNKLFTLTNNVSINNNIKNIIETFNKNIEILYNITNRIDNKIVDYDIILNSIYNTYTNIDNNTCNIMLREVVNKILSGNSVNAINSIIEIENKNIIKFTDISYNIKNLHKYINEDINNLIVNIAEINTDTININTLIDNIINQMEKDNIDIENINKIIYIMDILTNMYQYLASIITNIRHNISDNQIILITIVSILKKVFSNNIVNIYKDNNVN